MLLRCCGSPSQLDLGLAAGDFAEESTSDRTGKRADRLLRLPGFKALSGLRFCGHILQQIMLCRFFGPN
jgi:hypothetical protein